MRKSKRKALGQHFLHDQDVLRRIVKVIDPQPEDLIVEIGAGKGALTFCLTKKKAQIIALEKDKTLIPSLKKKEFSNLTVLEKDALRIKFGNLLQGREGKIVGNLPYAISSPLLFKVLEEKDSVSSCVFLLQKEVAQRVCALPGTKKYAPLTILFQNDFEAHLHFPVKASSFSPPPRVESALVSLRKHPKPFSLIPHQEGFIRFIRGAFRSRRKKLANNLKALDIPPIRIKKAYIACAIEETWRPEQVSLSRFVALYAYLFDNQSTQ
ncbi:MAG: ribosomal RNA small subunit methyltransferase A [Candidatus Aminicenantes bacterium]|nr:MAG: ribosomal RNA small subunit methyltransferase A [Candidatus Aminicenantes bacterium]